MKAPEELSTNTDELERFRKLVRDCSYVIAGLAGGALFIYLARFSTNGLGTTEQFGQFGDYLGGILNPTLSFITILLLVWSIKVQMNELSATREELKKSSDALEATKTTHQENLELLKRENIRKQIHDDFKNKVGIIEALLDKPIFPFFHPEQNGQTGFTLHSFNEISIFLENPTSALIYKKFIDGSKLHLELGQKETILTTRVSIAKNIEYISECLTELYKYLDNYYVALSARTQVDELINRCSLLNILSGDYVEHIKSKMLIPARLSEESLTSEKF